MLLTYGVIGFVNGMILILVFDVYYGSKEVMGALPSTPFDWFIILSIGVLTYIGPASLTIALQIESAGLLALIRKAFSIMFAYTFQITVFKVSHPITTYVVILMCVCDVNGKVFCFPYLQIVREPNTLYYFFRKHQMRLALEEPC